MAISTKNAGVYAGVVGVSVKTNGAYAAVLGVFAKVGGAYQSVLSASGGGSSGGNFTSQRASNGAAIFS